MLVSCIFAILLVSIFYGDNSGKSLSNTLVWACSNHIGKPRQYYGQTSLSVVMLRSGILLRNIWVLSFDFGYDRYDKDLCQHNTVKAAHDFISYINAYRLHQGFLAI